MKITGFGKVPQPAAQPLQKPPSMLQIRYRLYKRLIWEGVFLLALNLGLLITSIANIRQSTGWAQGVFGACAVVHIGCVAWCIWGICFLLRQK